MALIQVGVRLEKRMVKVLKAVAESFDVTLTDLLESIVLHSFEGGGANAFTDDVIPKITDSRKSTVLITAFALIFELADGIFPSQENPTRFFEAAPICGANWILKIK